MAEEEAKEADARKICELCKQEIFDSEHYIVSDCTNKQTCEELECHSMYGPTFMQSCAWSLLLLRLCKEVVVLSYVSCCFPLDR